MSEVCERAKKALDGITNGTWLAGPEGTALIRDLLAECRRLATERDEAIKARWRAQDTLARVRDVAEQHSRLGISIGPDALLDGLKEGTDGGH